MMMMVMKVMMVMMMMVMMMMIMMMMMMTMMKIMMVRSMMMKPLCASLRSQNALQHVTRAASYGDLQEKWRGPDGAS